VDQLLLKPMHNAKQWTCLHLVDVPRPIMELEA
jgi:hypothetical protein